MDSLLCRSVYQISFVIKPGSVAGAVPGTLIRIPGQLASHMRADDVNLKYLILLSLIYPGLSRCL